LEKKTFNDCLREKIKEKYPNCLEEQQVERILTAVDEDVQTIFAWCVSASD